MTSLLTNFTISPQLSGYVNATEFTFTKQLLDYSTTPPTPVDHARVAWDFGDGQISYDSLVTTHTYNYPGTYNITLSTFGFEGEVNTKTKSVEVDYFVRDCIEFTQIPELYADPGKLTEVPFTVAVTAVKTDRDPFLILHAADSLSIPSKYVPSKWNFLVPKWRFLLDDGTTETDVLSVATTPIYVEDKEVGRHGTASFYYVDDLGTGGFGRCPLLISATLSTEDYVHPEEDRIYSGVASFANSEVARAVVVWQVNQTVPTRLKVTSNFITDIAPVKWTGVPIPVMVTCENVRSDIFPSDNSPASMVLSYPPSNSAGDLGPLSLVLSGLPLSSYEVETDPLVFRRTDSEGNYEGGYVFTSITPLEAIDSTVVMASADIFNQDPDDPDDSPFPFPDGYTPTPFAFISHPLQGVVNKISLAYYPEDCPTVNYFNTLGLLIDGYQKTVEVPISEPPLSGDVVNYEMYGFAGVYGIAVDPRSSTVVVADAELATLTQYDLALVQISSVELEDFIVPVTDRTTPACLAIDSKSNIWVAAYDASYLAKFDSELNLLLSATPLSAAALSGTYLSADPAVAPSFIETDREDAVWTTSTHPLCSFIARYDEDGLLDWRVNLPNFSSPTCLTLDSSGGMWVCNSYNYGLSAGNIQLYSTAGDLLSTVSNVYRPLYIAADRSNDIWIAHGYNHISKYDVSALSATTWQLDSDTSSFAVVSPLSASSLSAEDIIWGGLSVDVYDRVWLVNQEENKVYVFSVDDPSRPRAISIKPKSDTMFIISPDDDTITTELSADNEPSAQAAGDWTGNRWFQKYATSLVSYEVSGVSTAFEVRDLSAEPAMQKINNEFNMAGYLDSLALPEILKRNRYLFEGFFEAAVGDGVYTLFGSDEDMGAIIYEKIANFVENKADLESCDIDQLLSFATLLGVGANKYGVDFPRAVRNAVDWFSISEDVMKGRTVTFVDLSACAQTRLNPATTTVPVGYSLILVDKATSQLLSAVTVSAEPLYQIALDGYVEPMSANYDFYTVKSSIASETLTSVSLIDWETNTTTISISSDEPWNSVIERNFDKILTENLFL